MSRNPVFWALEQTVGSLPVKGTLVFLASFADRHDTFCYPSQEKLAERCNCSVRNLRRHLDSLEAKGLIRRETIRTGNSKSDSYTRYHFLFNQPDNLSASQPDNLSPSDKGATGQKCHGNRTKMSRQPDNLSSHLSTNLSTDLVLSKNTVPTLERAPAGTRASESVQLVVKTLFDQIKEIYPERSGAQPWQRAEKALSARIKAGYSQEQILLGLARYIDYCEAGELVGTPYVMQSATFLGPELHFLEQWKTSKQKAKASRQERWGDIERWAAEE